MFSGAHCSDHIELNKSKEDISIRKVYKKWISRKVLQSASSIRNIWNDVGLLACLIVILPLVKWGDRSRRFGYLILKSTIDKVAALLALIVLSPLLVAIAIAIRLESPGPVFYKQERYGERTLPFKILKFRTMRIDQHPH